VSSKGKPLANDCNEHLQKEEANSREFTTDISSMTSNNLSSFSKWSEKQSLVIHSLQERVVEFVEEELKKDTPTGIPLLFYSLTVSFPVLVAIRTSQPTFRPW